MKLSFFIRTQKATNILLARPRMRAFLKDRKHFNYKDVRMVFTLVLHVFTGLKRNRTAGNYNSFIRYFILSIAYDMSQ